MLKSLAHTFDEFCSNYNAIEIFAIRNPKSNNKVDKILVDSGCKYHQNTKIKWLNYRNFK